MCEEGQIVKDLGRVKHEHGTLRFFRAKSYHDIMNSDKEGKCRIVYTLH